MPKIIKTLKKWFSPGLEIKRWIVLSTFGIAILIFGVVKLVSETSFTLRIIESLVVLLGVAVLVSGVRSMLRSFLSIFLPYPGEDLAEMLYKRRYLQRGPKIVAIGGGHGLAALLMGLKEYTDNLIAIVTVADSGGSSAG